MTKQQKSWLFSVGTVLFLVSIGSGIAHFQDELQQKANKLEVMQIETRFVAESLRTAAFRRDLYNRLVRIDSNTTRTYDCLSQILNDHKTFCR
jgi:hypothetical protein